MEQTTRLKKNDILTGSIGKAILGFFFPILIGTFFQQLYNTIDAVVVGNFAGTTALASVGGSSAIIINLVVGFFTGLSAGCTVKISQFYGAGDQEKLSAALHTSYAFGIAGGLFFGLLGVLASPSLLTAMNTPEALLAESTVYLRIYFAGVIFVFLYNMGAAILRALGDSVRPLVILIICTFVNIGLDLLFVVVLKKGVFGVAIATLISQAVSALLVSLVLMFMTTQTKLVPSRIRFNFPILGQMLWIGLPSGIQSSSYSLSNIFIQAAINSFGVNTVTGWTAEGKVDVLFWMINGSFGIAAATFVGQNFGAGNTERVRRGTRSCLFMALGSAVVISLTLFFFGRYPLYLFTRDEEVIEIGFHMMQVIVPGYFLFPFIEIFSASLRAQGDTLLPTIINITCVVVYRIIWLAIFGSRQDLDLVLYCYPISWFTCALLTSLYYLYRRHKGYRHSRV